MAVVSASSAFQIEEGHPRPKAADWKRVKCSFSLHCGHCGHLYMEFHLRGNHPLVPVCMMDLNRRRGKEFREIMTLLALDSHLTLRREPLSTS